MTPSPSINEFIKIYLLGFKYDDVKNQLNTSLQSLQVDKVDIFYLHWPDHKLPIEDTLRAVNDLYKGM